MAPAIVVFIIYLIPDGFINELMSGNPDPEYIAEEIMAVFSERTGSIVFLYLVMILYIMYLYMSYSFTLILIVDRGMTFWDAMETSRKVVAKNFFSFLAMYILLAVIIMLGVIVTCGLGTLVLIPYLYMVVFSAYDDILGPKEDIQEQNLEEFGAGAE